ncbi:MAG: hypothetical protein HZA08_04410 [Nitrospirae bacterium]|nr:hypothetical protein [Nitrospirota bacterium]
MAYLKTGKPIKSKSFLASIFLRLVSRFLLLTSYFLLLTSILAPRPAYAALQPSLSIVTGYYMPRLDELNYILKYREVELGPRNTEAKPSPYPVIYQGYSPEGMPKMSPKSPKFGLQFQVDINPRYSVFIGNSVATYDSEKRDVRSFFVGFSIPSDRVTRFSLSLNQLWIGVKRNWIFEEKGKPEERSKRQEARSKKEEDGSKKQEARSQKQEESQKQEDRSKKAEEKPASKLYVEMGVLAVTRAYLTTDVWLHVYAPEEGFDFYKVTETLSQGYGYATFIGIGGEYFIKKWMSLGLDADYTIGGVSKIKYARYFTVDPLEKDIIKPGDKVTYTDLKVGRVAPLFINLEGVDIKGQVRFYF